MCVPLHYSTGCSTPVVFCRIALQEMGYYRTTARSKVGKSLTDNSTRGSFVFAWIFRFEACGRDAGSFGATAHRDHLIGVFTCLPVPVLILTSCHSDKYLKGTKLYSRLYSCTAASCLSKMLLFNRRLILGAPMPILALLYWF